MKKDLDYFIEKLKKIPSNKWTIKNFNDGCGRHCVLGHLGTKENCDYLSAEAIEISLLVYPGSMMLGANHIAKVNDGYDKKVKGKTPKTRVLNYLKSLKRKK